MSAISHKQGGYLFRLTGLKFWEPENRPEPTSAEASAIIEACLTWLNEGRTAEQKSAVVALVRKFFPDWDGSSLRAPFYSKRKTAPASQASLPGFTPEQPAPQPEPAPEIPAEPQPPKAKKTSAPKPTPEKKPAPAAAPKAPRTTPPAEGDTKEQLKARIEAGLTNFWLYGPAGTGKTTMCRELAEELELPCTILSCSAGTSPAEITGFKYPEPRASAISRAIGQPGIIVLDEMPMLEPDVAAVCNALLANNELETSTGHVIRDPDCIIIATANTTGTGSDRQYIGNNQLDAATLDRFTGGFIAVDYSREFEDQFDREVVTYCRHLRQMIKAHALQRIVSTRSVIAAHKLKTAGLDWKAALVSTWTADEKHIAGANS